MNRLREVKRKFVEYMPDELDLGVIYISVSFATAGHLCLCGCGEEVVTPFSPTDWELSFDGETISLDPSVGNWGFRCRSHYIIRHNRVIWAGNMSQAEIDAGRERDRLSKFARYGSSKAQHRPVHREPPERNGTWVSMLHELWVWILHKLGRN